MTHNFPNFQRGERQQRSEQIQDDRTEITGNKDEFNDTVKVDVQGIRGSALSLPFLNWSLETASRAGLDGARS